MAMDTQSWQPPALVDKMSYPSTGAKGMGDIKADYEGYPFEDWSDLTEDQKYILAATKIGNALVGQVVAGIAEKAIGDARAAAMQTEDARAMAYIVMRAVESAHRWQAQHEAREAQRKVEEAARNSKGGPSDLMAEGHMLMKARQHVEGVRKGLERAVSFDRPVAQYTCLYGDMIAKPGDMLTAVTVTDTEEQVIRSMGGPVRTIYTAKAISV